MQDGRRVHSTVPVVIPSLLQREVQLLETRVYESDDSGLSGKDVVLSNTVYDFIGALLVQPRS